VENEIIEKNGVKDVDSANELEVEEVALADLEQEALSEAAEIEAIETVPVNENIRWYIMQCYSGQEYKVRDRIQHLMEEGVFQGKVTKILIPEEETIEIKETKRIERVVKVYPGYIFIEMEPNEDIWFQFRKIPGISKFIGTKNKPVPITEDEVLRVLRKTEDKVKKIEVDFEMGEVVKIINGPFRGYSGPINDINGEKGKLKALILIFGRETPVELDFNQVEKALK
jgi:transcriptional antiterminator NusG